MKIIVEADGDGFLAKVSDKLINTFAWGKTQKEALAELLLVIESIMDIHQEEVQKAKQAKKMLLNQDIAYAV